MKLKGSLSNPENVKQKIVEKYPRVQGHCRRVASPQLGGCFLIIIKTENGISGSELQQSEIRIGALLFCLRINFHLCHLHTSLWNSLMNHSNVHKFNTGLTLNNETLTFSKLLWKTSLKIEKEGTVS